MTKDINERPKAIFFAEQIKARRKELGLDIARLSKSCKIPIGDLVDFENGIRTLNVGDIQKLSKNLNIPIAVFNDDENHKKSEQQNAELELSMQGLLLNQSFVEINDEVLRKELVELVQIVKNRAGQSTPREISNLIENIASLKNRLHREVTQS